MTVAIIYIVSLVFVAFYAAVRFRYELQMLQQNSYRLSRYWRWFLGDRHNPDRLIDLLILAISPFYTILPFGARWAPYFIGAIGVLALYRSVRQLLRKYKKPLVFTSRAVRIFFVGLLLLAATLHFTPWHLVSATILSMAFATFSPLWISLALILLMPVERLINAWYIRDARRILSAMPRLIIIGITGSYGKTSTKHYLYRILSERFSVVMTPGSFNTTLGVVRTIREHLKPYTEVFIVEMGAKQPGDVAEICDLVHPSIGILTSVGEQHLESFKTIENVQKTKFELIDSLPADGVAILNDDFPYIASRPVTNVATVLRYSSDDLKNPPFTTRLVGAHNIGNIYAAWLAGKALGMTDDEMLYAISDLKPIEHRLEVKHVGGLTIIDDAFNSNPSGAAAALDVLAGFTGGRRIVVTPGMIELGTRQYELNRTFGNQIASSCDYAIIVGEYNRDAILQGLSEASFPSDKIFAAPTFNSASAHVHQITKPGDTILYENDLPDTFK